MDWAIQRWGFTGLELVWVAAEAVIACCPRFGLWSTEVGGVRVGVGHHVTGVESDGGVEMGGCIEQAQADFEGFLSAFGLG